MGYTVLVRFKDLQDNGRVYSVGDKFPRAGLEVSPERLEELSTTKNRRHIRLIAGTPDENIPENTSPLTEEVPLEVQTDVNPSEESEAQEKPKKTPRRNTRSKKDAGADS